MNIAEILLQRAAEFGDRPALVDVHRNRDRSYSFRELDLMRLKHMMARPVVVDLDNVYRPEEMVKHGFIYEGIGRPAPVQD